jgi:hypothetical protein
MDIYELFAAAQAHSLPDEPDNNDGADPAAAAAAAGAEGGEGGEGGEAAAAADEPPAGGEEDAPPADTDTPAEVTAEEESAAVLAAMDEVLGETKPNPTAEEAAAAEAAAAAAKEGEGADPKIVAADAEKDAIEKEAEAEADKLGIKNEAANQKFKEMYREVQRIPELEQRAGRGDELFTAIQRSGATGDQFGTALFYLEAVNTGDVAKLAQAHDWLQTELAWLAEKLGKPKPGADILEGHEDLRAAVEEGMQRDKAEELARARDAQRLQQQAREQALQRERQRNDQQTQQGEQIERARTEVNVLAGRLVAEETTPEGQAHAKALLEHILANDKARITSLPPHQWPSEIELAYLRLKARNPAPKPAPAPAAVAAAARAPARVSHQPLRPVGGVAQPVKTPTTEMEAIEQGIALANSGTFGGY